MEFIVEGFLQVHIIQLSKHNADIICEGLYNHRNEIWDFAACPFDKQIISTVYASGTALLSVWYL